MFETSDLRKGLKILIDGNPYIIVTSQFVKPGKGTAFTKTRLKNLLTGQTLDRTFRSGEKIGRANTEEKEMQYLYAEGEAMCFMDNTSFEQVNIPKDVIGDDADLLSENLTVTVLFFSERPVGVTLPNFVELEVTESEPGIKGNTATGATKPAIVSSGASINVPLFVEQGDWLKIDTRTRSYVERVKK